MSDQNLNTVVIPKVTLENYPALALETEKVPDGPVTFTPEQVQAASNILPAVIDVGRDADIIKRWLAYRKEPPTAFKEMMRATADFKKGMLANSEPDLLVTVSAAQFRLLHAALGMVTEAAELMDMVYKHVFEDQPLDTTNIKEELGDSWWYAPILQQVLGFTELEVKQLNIAKLRHRMKGNKFDSLHVLERDLANERKVLEGQTINPALQAKLESMGERTRETTLLVDGPSDFTGVVKKFTERQDAYRDSGLLDDDKPSGPLPSQGYQP